MKLFSKLHTPFPRSTLEPEINTILIWKNSNAAHVGSFLINRTKQQWIILNLITAWVI